MFFADIVPMKYIAQYIKKLCPDVVITHSKTTESVYYDMGHNFVVRLSCHIGWKDKGQISIVKSFNTDDFILMVDKSPFPLIKDRKSVKEFIRVNYETSTLLALSKIHHDTKKRLEFEGIDSWEVFWSQVCDRAPNARFLTPAQKLIIRKYFEEGLRGMKMLSVIKKMRPTTDESIITEWLCDSLEESKK